MGTSEKRGKVVSCSLPSIFTGPDLMFSGRRSDLMIIPRYAFPQENVIPDEKWDIRVAPIHENTKQSFRGHTCLCSGTDGFHGTTMSKLK